MLLNEKEPTLEDLLAAANAAPEKEEPVANDVVVWINTVGVKPGPDHINKHLLYRIYENWSLDPVEKNEWNKVMKTLFEWPNEIFYRIDRNSIQSARTELLNYIGVRRNAQKKRRKKTRNKVAGT